MRFDYQGVSSPTTTWGANFPFCFLSVHSTYSSANVVGALAPIDVLHIVMGYFSFLSSSIVVILLMFSLLKIPTV